MQVKDILKHFDAGKIQALNLSNLTYELSSRQTIEFRCPNGTINAHTWQKNVLFFIRLLEYATNPHFDEELINYHINHFDFNKANLKNYNLENFKLYKELIKLIAKNESEKYLFELPSLKIISK